LPDFVLHEADFTSKSTDMGKNMVDLDFFEVDLTAQKPIFCLETTSLGQNQANFQPQIVPKFP
jgi:hypothetical protein